MTIAQLCSGESGVLVVELERFTGAPTLSGLLSRSAGWTVWHIDPVRDLATIVEPPSFVDMVAGYVHELVERHDQPTVVVGYCSAAELARGIAAELTRTGRPSLDVIVEPVWPDAGTLGAEFRTLRKGLGLDGGEWAPCDFAAMMSTLDFDLRALARADGLDATDEDDFVSLLLNRYRAWLGYLFACSTRPPAGSVSALRILSQAHNGAGPPAAREVRVALPPDGLFDRPDVGDVILEFAGSVRRVHSPMAS
jgi:hypothetical protein